jgi:hypothetical protein
LTVTIQQCKQKTKWDDEGEAIGKKNAWTTEKVVVVVPDETEEAESKTGKDSWRCGDGVCSRGIER